MILCLQSDLITNKQIKLHKSKYCIDWLALRGENENILLYRILPLYRAHINFVCGDVIDDVILDDDVIVHNDKGMRYQISGPYRPHG